MSSLEVQLGAMKVHLDYLVEREKQREDECAKHRQETQVIRAWQADFDSRVEGVKTLYRAVGVAFAVIGGVFLLGGWARSLMDFIRRAL